MAGLADSCVITENTHGGILLDKRSGEYYSLNPLALRILRELEGDLSVNDIVKGISADFDQSKKVVLEDVELIIKKFTELGILVERP